MTTAVDTNVFIALWNPSDSLNTAAAAALRSIKDRIVISGPVYAELLGSPGRTAEFLDAFCSEAQIHIDWLIGEELWRIAGKEYGNYSERRRKARSGLPRRILADFLIGAHATANGYALLTLDDKLFRASFPKLRIICI